MTQLDYYALGYVIFQREATCTTLEREICLTCEPVHSQITRIIGLSNSFADLPFAIVPTPKPQTTQTPRVSTLGGCGPGI